MERTNLVEIANKAIKGAENLYISNSFQALASGDASEIQSICIQVGQNTIDDDGDFEPEKYTQQVKDTIVMKVEKSVGQGLIKNELGNGCTVYTIDDAGMSLNIYDTDYGFWATLVYNLD